MQRSSRSGVLVISAWHEPGNGPGLRARIRWSLEAEPSGSGTALVSGSAEEVTRTVAEWLERLGAQPVTRQ